MARGNQRDLAREKNLKKQKEQQKNKGAAEKGSNLGLNFDARQQRDAEAMRKKQEAAAAKKAAEEAANASKGPKVVKYDPLK
uniref:4F5 domain-containing protein n=1 Tax=Strongyloides venezuelensis TaxID=75913 RepID=A0A0K0G270_STRVS